MQSFFYGKGLPDMNKIAKHLLDCGIIPKMREPYEHKKTGYASNYIVTAAGSGTEKLLEAGVVIGKKVGQEFSVPSWVMSHESLEVKRAFMAAIWGAEGSAPKSEDSPSALKRNANQRGCRTLKLEMTKHPGVDGSAFFSQMRSLLSDLGIKSEVSKYSRRGNTCWLLLIDSNKENIVRFLSDVGCLYCQEKQTKFWLWSEYLKAYLFDAKKKIEPLLRLRNQGASDAEIGRQFGMKTSRITSLLAPKVSIRCSKSFPLFPDWLAERWDAERKTLKVFVVSCKESGHDEVWNMHVDSHDRSYLVQSGINNFNSWESPTGKVYQPFQRSKHVVSYVDDDGKCNLHLGLDFNRSPMSGVLMVKFINGDGDECLCAIDEILMPNATIQRYADLLRDRFAGRNLIIYPDASGNQQHTSAGGNTNHSVLRGMGFKLIHPRKNPSITDRVNTVNGAFHSADDKIKLFIHPRCKELITALESLGFDEGGSVAKIAQSRFTHLPDALGYAVMQLAPIIKRNFRGGMVKLTGA